MSSDKIQGGAMGGVDELYREVILDHFKKPKNKGRVPDANVQADGMNPLCGDQISMTALIEGGVIRKIGFEGHGCAISQSAASMLTQAAVGKTIAEFREIAKAYKTMFAVSDPSLPETSMTAEDLGDLVSLEGVKKYPVRIKCALLACNTLLEGVAPFSQ